MISALPPAIEHALDRPADPKAMLLATLQAVTEALAADRCFVHVRDPDERVFENLCWRRHRNVPDTSTFGWEREQAWEHDDPMFKAALACAPSIFVEDVERADPALLNADFERAHFGHRALIHAHCCDGDVLWAILQPAVFDAPRIWSAAYRALIGAVLPRLLPVVQARVKESADAIRKVLTPTGD
ncbi:MAG: hypothetical protein KIT73_06865 [Burkholderiales bacterium]|nr:hypothetical protein [Burkholderiales bacterium]